MNQISNEEELVQHETIIHLDQISKRFDFGDSKILALEEINLEVKSRDFLVIYGPSGCGKSTLLNIIAGAETPTTGTVKVRGQNLYLLDEDARGDFRSHKMGIVYQMSYWVKSLNVLENVALPLLIEGHPERKALQKAHHTLEELQLDRFEKQNPTQLSGGEQQRIGFARAIVANPWIVIADEPTGNLDSTSADEVMALFDSLNIKSKKTVILVTHNPAYWTLGNRRVEMKDGKIIKETYNG